MAAFGYSASEFVAVAQLAFRTYQLVCKCGENFAKLGLDVECLLVNVSSLSDANTQSLIDQYVSDDAKQVRFRGAENGLSPRQREIEALKKGLEDIVLPLVVLFVSNRDLFPAEASGKRSTITTSIVMSASDKIIQAFEKAEKRSEYRKWKISEWFRYARAAFKLDDLTEVRSRCNLHATNLNLFMTRLMQRQIQLEAEVSRKQSELQMAAQNAAIMSQLQRQYELQALTSARQLLFRADSRYTEEIDLGVRRFEKDVAAYVAHLLDGGAPLVRKDSSSGLRPTLHQSIDYKQNLSQSYERTRLEEEELMRLKLMKRERIESEVRMKERIAADVKLHEKPLQSVIDMETRAKLVEASQRVAFESSGFECDRCGDEIFINDQYYTCPSGKNHKDRSTFDLCLDCYEDQHSCSSSQCEPMVMATMRRQTATVRREYVLRIDDRSPKRH